MGTRYYFDFFSLVSSCHAAGSEVKRKVLYIDSYQPEYAWSAQITSGVVTVLGKRKDIELKIIRMDTKRNKAEAFKKAAALKAQKGD